MKQIIYNITKKKKRESISIAIGVLFVLGLIILGVVSSHNVLSENRYVGDKSTNEYYDLSKCVVSIQQSNLVKFQNIDEAKAKGFESATCNR